MTEAIIKYKCGHEIKRIYTRNVGKREVARQQNWSKTQLCYKCENALSEAK